MKVKLTRSKLRELIKTSLEELKFGSKAQYDAYKKKHHIKPGTKVKVGDKTTTHKGKGKISKAAAKKADKMAADMNAKLDAAEKEMSTGGPSYANVPKGAKTSKQAKAMKKKKKESVEESTKRRYTVKEIRMWMKKLEENRYKKVYNSDARRVSWMVNNEGVSLSEMPISFLKPE